MHWRNRRAVSAYVCQIGARISSTSALATSEIGIFPMRGKAYPQSAISIHGSMSMGRENARGSVGLASSVCRVTCRRPKRFGAGSMKTPTGSEPSVPVPVA